MADQPRTDLKQRLLIRIISEGGAAQGRGRRCWENEYERMRHQFDHSLAGGDEE